MHDIFLSYASGDRDRAKALAAALQSHGHRVWWDRRIPAGRTFAQVITEALENTRCVVVLWSKESIKSTWILEEAEEGRKRGILVPVFMEAVSPPVGFRSIQAADLIGWNGQTDAAGLIQLIDDIKTLLGPSSPQSVRNESTSSKPPAASQATSPKDLELKSAQGQGDIALERVHQTAPKLKGEQSRAAIRETSFSTVRLFLLMQLAGAAITTAIAYGRTEIIILSGPLVSAIGLFVAVLGWRKGNRYVVATGLSAPIVSMLVLVLIVGFGLTETEAQAPVTAIAALYTLMLGVLVWPSKGRG